MTSEEQMKLNKQWQEECDLKRYKNQARQQSLDAALGLSKIHPAKIDKETKLPTADDMLKEAEKIFEFLIKDVSDSKLG